MPREGPSVAGAEVLHRASNNQGYHNRCPGVRQRRDASVANAAWVNVLATDLQAGVTKRIDCAKSEMRKKAKAFWDQPCGLSLTARNRIIRRGHLADSCTNEFRYYFGVRCQSGVSSHR